MVALLMPAACWMARVCVPAPCMRTWKGRRLGVPVWVDCTTEVVGVLAPVAITSPEPERRVNPPWMPRCRRRPAGVDWVAMAMSADETRDLRDPQVGKLTHGGCRPPHHSRG